MKKNVSFDKSCFEIYRKSATTDFITTGSGACISALYNNKKNVIFSITLLPPFDRLWPENQTVRQVRIFFQNFTEINANLNTRVQSCHCSRISVFFLLLFHYYTVTPHVNEPLMSSPISLTFIVIELVSYFKRDEKKYQSLIFIFSFLQRERKTVN